VRVSVVRLPPTVHGEGDHGFVPRLADIAPEKGASAPPATGPTGWPAVHRIDAAKVFCPAPQEAPAGALLHEVDEEGVATRGVGGAPSVNTLAMPERPAKVAPEEALNHFGWLGGFFFTRRPASSTWTRKQLG
jgi:hypothetical protein